MSASATEPKRIVYEDANLRAFYYAGTSNHCLVTFTPWASQPPAAPFAEQFVRKSGTEAVAFQSMQNDWWQSGSVEQGIAEILPMIRSTVRVTYGSSMGGYAAIAFADMLQCSRAIAISPQASIDRQLVPWETRWEEEARRFAMPRGNAGTGARLASVHLVYDPLVVLDRKHAELISSAATGRVLHHRFSFSGHPSGPALLECGLLQELVLRLVAGNVEDGDLVARFRKARFRSRSSMMALLTNHHILRSHKSLAGAAIDRYRTECRADGKTLFLVARYLVSVGRKAEASEVLASATPSSPKNAEEIRRLRARI